MTQPSIQLVRVGLGRLLAVLLVLGVWGCAGSDEPETTPDEETVAQVRPELEPPPGPLPPPIREVPATTRERVQVIDGKRGEDAEPQTLIEASRLAKQRKREQGVVKPTIEINDENLAEYAEGAEVIILESEPAAPLGAPSAAGSVDPNDGSQDQALDDAFRDDAFRDGDIRDESYWRDRALELRMNLRRTVDDISDLQLESAALRQQYYAEEDTYTRDNDIKPAWDRVLDRLEATKTRALRTQRELDAFLQEGRRAGALQGWLNQGWELEPSDVELRMVEGIGVAESREPVTRDPVLNDQ